MEADKGKTSTSLSFETAQVSHGQFRYVEVAMMHYQITFVTDYTMVERKYLQIFHNLNFFSAIFVMLMD